MRNTQLNKIKMYDTVQSVIKKHQTVWNDTPAFAEAYAAFAEKLESLKALSNEHINSTKGVTALKREVQNKAIEQAITLSNVLGALALKMGDTELLMRNIYSRSEWGRGSVLLRVNRFKHVLTDAVEHEVALAEYGVDATIILTFEESMLNYEAISKQTRTAIVSRKQMTKAIVDSFAELDEILNGQLLRIISVFGQTDPKFVNTFKNARVIVDHKGKRNKPKGENSPAEPDDGSEPPIGDE